MLTLLSIRLRSSSQAGNACDGYRTSNSAGAGQHLFHRGKVSQLSPAVWVCQLRSLGVSGGFQLAGNAFPIDPAPAKHSILEESADIKPIFAAIKQENPNTVSCDAYQIDIYRQEDGRWVKEGKMAASLRETDEAIAMAAYYQPKPRLRRLPQQCSILHCSNLHHWPNLALTSFVLA
ncbi:unnamed protein product [Effrenium voratum]|nr:unnamed protein product [Effrenium voratum]